MDQTSTADPMLQQFLAGRDATCPGCDYNVRDLVGDVCPECGQRLVLSVRLQEPKQAGLIAGLVALSAGAGLGGLLLIYAVIAFYLYGRGGPPGRFLTINGIGLATHATAIALWVWKWNAIRRLTALRRAALIGVCVAMPLVFVVVFALYIR